MSTVFGLKEDSVNLMLTAWLLLSAWAYDWKLYLMMLVAITMSEWTLIVMDYIAYVVKQYTLLLQLEMQKDK